MTVLNLMEMAGTRDTALAIEWIKNCVNLIQSSYPEKVKIYKQAVIEDEREYELPNDMISLISVSVLDTADDDKYKLIRKLASDPITSEDTNP